MLESVHPEIPEKGKEKPRSNEKGQEVRGILGNWIIVWIRLEESMQLETVNSELTNLTFPDFFFKLYITSYFNYA